MANSILDDGALFFGSAEQRVFRDFANEDYLSLEFGNDDTEEEEGRGGLIIGDVINSDRATLTVRLVRGSPDDTFLQGLRSDYKRSPKTFVFMTGNASISHGNGDGTFTTENYLLTKGIFSKKPDFKGNRGNTEAGIAVWVFKVTAVRNFA